MSTRSLPVFYYNTTSFLQNQYRMQIHTDWEQVPLYRHIRKIHQLFPLYDAEALGEGEPSPTLVRVGRNRDGGYLMLKPFSDTPVAYSFGIGGDVSWDAYMAGEGYQVWQYDHTIEALPAENPAFHWQKTGLGPRLDEEQHLDSLENMLRKNGHAETTGMALKMDIEWAEWDAFDEMKEETLGQFDQIAMELHFYLTPDDDWPKIFRGLEKLARRFALVHVHGNNSGRIVYCKDYVLPEALEVTLVRKDKYRLTKSSRVLPHPLDRGNEEYRPDFYMGGWNLDE